MIKIFPQSFRKFRDDETGTATIESLLWMPIFFFLFVLITNASFIFYGKAQALKIIQDGNRTFAVGRITDADDAKDAIEVKLVKLANGQPVEILMDVTDGVITTTATISAIDLMPVKVATNFTNLRITINSAHFKED